MPPTSRPDLLARALALGGVAPVLAACSASGGVGRVALVGGAVRDLYRGSDAVIDADLVVEGDVDAVLRALGDTASAILRHPRFETATVTVEGFPVDLAASRRERYTLPGALPTVAPAPLEEDMLRRDFTVNAIALVLAGGSPGSLVAAPGALDDLDAGVLRVLHARSFFDDPTRLMRLCRYAGRLGFGVASSTEALAREAIAAGVPETISASRLGREVRLLSCEADPVPGFLWLGHLGVDSAVAPGFGITDPGLVERALRLLPGDCRRDLVVLACALAAVEPDALPGVLERLDTPAADRRVITSIVSRAGRLSARLEMAGGLSEIDAAVRWFATGAVGTAELVAVAGAIHPAGAAREWLVELRHRKLAITGADVRRAAGGLSGPAIGAGLAAARAAMLDGDAPDRDAQLSVAVRAATAPPGA